MFKQLYFGVSSSIGRSRQVIGRSERVVIVCKVLEIIFGFVSGIGMDIPFCNYRSILGKFEFVIQFIGNFIFAVEPTDEVVTCVYRCGQAYCRIVFIFAVCGTIYSSRFFILRRNRIVVLISRIVHFQY